MSCASPQALLNYFFAGPASDFFCTQALSSLQMPTTITALAYLKVFFLTCLLEAPIYWIALRSSSRNWIARFGIVVALNLATHPAVYFFWPWFVSKLGGRYYQTLIVAEIFAPAVEAKLLAYWAPMSFRRAILFAVAANLFSWSIGTWLSI
jgi:hypothetical protein